MVKHDPNLPPEFDELGKQGGYSADGFVVPSAVGMPLDLGLTPDQSVKHSKRVLDAAKRGFGGAIKITR